MKSLWAGFVLGVKTLVNDPIGYLTDPVAATTKQYQKDLKEEGLTNEQIKQAVVVYHETGGVLKDIGQAYGQVTGAVGDIFKSIGNFTNFIGKNFMLIVILGLIMFGLYYFLPVLLKLKVARG